MLHELMLLAALGNVLLGLKGFGGAVPKEETHGSERALKFCFGYHS